MKIYGLYDTKYKEQCLTVGTIPELAKCLECSRNNLDSQLSKIRQGKIRGLVRHRYEIVEIGEENE